MPDGSYETAELLIAEAKARGYSINGTLLKRWYAWGLLPRYSDRTRQKGAGKAHGSTTIHPTGTLPQLLRLLEIRDEAGRFNPERALWRLWWEGWQIDPKLIKKHLVAAIEELQQDLFEFQQTVESSEAVSLSSFSDTRLPPVLARARKRSGKAAFETVAVLVTDLVAGQFADIPQDSEDMPTVLRALGSDAGGATLTPNRHRFEQDLSASLGKLSDMIAPSQLREGLAESTAIDLETARQELRALLTFARRFWPLVEMTLPRSTTVRDLWALSPSESADLLPSAVLLWLTLRRNPPWSEITRFATAIVREGDRKTAVEQEPSPENVTSRRR